MRTYLSSYARPFDPDQPTPWAATPAALAELADCVAYGPYPLGGGALGSPTVADVVADAVHVFASELGLDCHCCLPGVPGSTQAMNAWQAGREMGARV